MEGLKKYKFIARMIAKGKLTVPEDIRKFLEIDDGDYVEVVIRKMDMSTKNEDFKT